MLKTGFRGERKGILTPSLSQGEGGMWRRKKGNVATEKRKKPPPSPLQRGSVVTEKWECGGGKRVSYPEIGLQ